MKTLRAHNQIQSRAYNLKITSDPVRNGIECPRCKCELWDTNPQVTLTSMPPQKGIHCIACGFFGYRLA